MDEHFFHLQQYLEDKELPDYPSFLPIEIRDKEITDRLIKINAFVEKEIVKDNDKLCLLHSFTSLPIDTDLVEIEQLLKRYKPVNGDFFEDIVIKGRGTAQEVGTEKSQYEGFTTASNKPLKKQEIKDGKEKNEVDAECNVESYIVERIRNEILEKSIDLTWDDIVGLENVKRTVNEIVLWPMLRPDLFTGLRGPPKGLLLFGPPGTGKTMIGKCIASQCKATFFSISASSLTSKWVGEGEKMVRALFYLARSMQPSVIFIDEIDSLLSQRTDNENEGSRRIKTEFLVQFDGAATTDNDKILIIGATNRPHEIDEAARRRLVKRIYVPLPEENARRQMVQQLIRTYSNNIDDTGLDEISKSTAGYSGSDMFNLCREASLEPLREIDNISNFKSEDTRPISVQDFMKAMKQIRKSVSEKDITQYLEWNSKFGSF